MKSFIKVVEIWTPRADRQVLTLSDGLYEGSEELHRYSLNQAFAYGKGLPGKAWATAAPLVITDLQSVSFEGNAELLQAGFSSAVAMPFFSGEFLLAVVVLLCGGDQRHAGAVELWGRPDDGESSLALLNGYYGSLESLAKASRNIRFEKGQGLPGSAWDYRIPMLITDPLNSSLFKRAGSAAIEGVTAAIAIPFMHHSGSESVLSLLSSGANPIARRFEVWLPDRDHRHLVLHAAKCDAGEELLSIYEGREISRGQGLLGRVWLSGRPAVSTAPVDDELVMPETGAGLNGGLVMPVIEEGVLRAVVAMMF